MLRAGSGQSAVPTTRAGMPATVVFAATGRRTTEPAATRAHVPISMLDFRTGADHGAPSDFRVPVAGFLAGAAQRDVLQDRDVILDDGGCPHHQPGRVVEEDPLPEAGRRVDVGLEDVGRTALQVEREIPAIVGPQPVRRPVRLDRMKALEVEERLDEPLARRIAIHHRGDVGPHRIADAWIERASLTKDIGDDARPQYLVSEARGDAMKDRRFERGLTEIELKNKVASIGSLATASSASREAAPKGFHCRFLPAGEERRPD